MSTTKKPPRRTGIAAVKSAPVFAACLLAGALLIVLAFGLAVYQNAMQADTFETLLVENVEVAHLGVDEKSVRSFAVETMQYLTDEKENWEPQISVAGFPAGSFIPQSFRDHMAEVKTGFSAAKSVFWAGVGLAAALLLGCFWGGKNRRFSAGGYYLGAGVALLLMAAIGLWAYFDFNGLWQLLHKYFIPDGIFSATEQIMAFFPVTLFAGYLPPVMTSFALLTAAALVLPLGLSLLAKVLPKKGLR